MVILPLVIGVVLGPRWVQIPITVAWFAGYFCFFALTIRLKSRRAGTPTLVYGAIAAVAAAVALLMQPALVWWALAFLPPFAVAVWEAAHRRSRSLLSGIATVAVAVLMTPVAAPRLDAEVWTITALEALYFVGSLLYVKTLIRKRGNPRWFAASVIYHVAAAIVAMVLTRSWVAAIVFTLLAVRSWVVPRVGAKRRITPKAAGQGEVLSLFGLLAACFLLPA